MKKFTVLAVCAFMLGLGLFSCASFKAIAHLDDDIYAELEVEDSDYVILYVKNNTNAQIQILSDKSYYSNGRYNSVLIPYEERYMTRGTLVPPVNIPPQRELTQRFVASKAVEYDEDEFNINNWTPRDSEEIVAAYFYFEYEINGVTKQLIFEGKDFVELE
jgi:hypothetical protein